MAPRPDASRHAIPVTGENVSSPAPISALHLGSRPPTTPGRRAAGDTWWERAKFELSDTVTSGALSERLVRASAAVEAPITTGRRIVVLGVCGGVGTTTVAAFSAKLLGSIRQEPVMAIDATDESGRLLHYVGADQAALLSAAASTLRRRPVRTLPDLVASAASCGNQVLALGRSDVAASVDSPIRANEWTDLTAIFSRFVAVTVVDAGASPKSRQTDALLGTAHAVILVAPDTDFGTQRAAAIQRTLLENHDGIPVTTVLTGITSPNRHSLHAAGLPYDRHLAAGGPIRLSHLGARTRIAATEITGSALSAANRR